MMPAKILVIDDENLFREDLAKLLSRRGYDCKTAVDGNMGLTVAEEFGPDVILCDIVMPGQNGIELLGELLRICPECFVIMITAYGTIDTAVEAFRRGASDYIMKPLLIEDVLLKIERLIDHKLLNREIRFLKRQLHREIEGSLLIGESGQMQKVRELIRKVSTTTTTVLITGASGTGKELVARSIHKNSASAQEPFVAINCAGIPEHLLESELFGHTKGAFTGADTEREGFFEIAGSGTILLDEIGEMPLVLQSKLLRVVEEREFIRVGGKKSIPAKARFMASTNKNLEELVQSGQFRQDLYFRLAVFEIHVPSLKKRRDDIALLCEHLLKKLNKELKRNCRGLDNDAIRMILSYSWPGNVRELRNVIERAMILATGEFITPAELPPQIAGSVEFPKNSDDLRISVAAYEKEHIRRVLSAAGGNKEECSRRLGINASTLYRKMADLGMINNSSS
ncbi:MAG: sigma-54-dependent Fis family transcriptional regulator [Planctomycetes bacterium]|nr:sigma-54-dependent Fis family transcriptional regulator [Planctomycetota bacterium]